MLKYLLVLIAAVATANTSAQVFKCKGADGKVQFSDIACKTGTTSEIVPERAPLTQQQRSEAQQRALQMQSQAAARDDDKLTAQSSNPGDQLRQESASAQKAADKVIASDADAVANCVRDVERRGASQDVKAEMIAACRTAGLAQRSTGQSSDAVSDCVKRVERTGASEKEKTRQLAICHGGDVQPEPRRSPRSASFGGQPTP